MFSPRDYVDQECFFLSFFFPVAAVKFEFSGSSSTEPRYFLGVILRAAPTDWRNAGNSFLFSQFRCCHVFTFAKLRLLRLFALCLFALHVFFCLPG
jgi:hypothetical protein